MEKLSLSLKHWPDANAGSLSIEELIRRVNDQRGGFRNITEDSLIEESQRDLADDEDEDESSSDDGEDEAESSREAELALAKGELLRHLAQAHNDVIMALDFVSLLLSADTPRQAEVTISQVLQQSVPLGSLTSEKVQPPIETQGKGSSQLMSRGWKAKAFKSAAGLMADTAALLATEAQKEEIYWHEIMEIRSAGWIVSRLPKDRHMLGVRFGFAEASKVYRDRGLAVLRRGDDGRISLDHGILYSPNTDVRIRIRSKGVIESSSTRPYDAPSTDSINLSILGARNTIFEDELFHELTREARTLGNFGVQTSTNLITVPFDDETEILIDLVSPDSEGTLESTSDAFKAEVVATFARALLCHGHYLNKEKRSQIPPPISDRPPPPVYYHILKPIMAYFGHLVALKPLNESLKSIRKLAKQAGLEFSVLTDGFKNLDSLSDSNSSTTSMIESMLRYISSNFTIKMPDKSEVTLEVVTFPGKPTFGTEYVAHTHGTEISRDDPRFRTAKQATEYITWMLQKAIAQEIIQRTEELDAEEKKPKQWALSHYPNELVRSVGFADYLLKVQAAPNRLTIIHGWRSGEPMHEIWNIDETTTKRTLSEMIGAISYKKEKQ